MLTLQKGEISIEFIICIGIILIIFVTIVVVVGLKNKDITDTMIYSEAQKVSNIITSEINNAATIEGYYREFSIPPSLVNSINYSVTIRKEFRLVEIKWNNKNVINYIATENVSGTIKPGINKIKNEGGMVIIES